MFPSHDTGAKEVVRFRDDAFHMYFENPAYLDMIENTFGAEVRKHMMEITSTRLKRKILE